MKKPRVKLPANFNDISTQTAQLLGLQTEAAKEVLKVALEGVLLCDAKQLDYGLSNISAFGEHGVLVRVNDKLERLKNLYNSRKRPRNESVDDSWADIANYGLIAIVVRRGLWK